MMTNEIRPCTLLDYRAFFRQRECEFTPNQITIDALTVTSVDVKCVFNQGVEYFYYVVSYRPEQDYSESQFGGRMSFVFGEQFLSFKKATNDAMRVLDAISEKRNAPVLATDEVLAGLMEDAQFLVYRAWGDPPKENPFQHCNLHPAYQFRKNDKEAYKWYFTDAIIVDKGLRHSPVLGFRIKSNGCPKTAEYLLQFTLDGVRIKEGV